MAFKIPAVLSVAIMILVNDVRTSNCSTNRLNRRPRFFSQIFLFRFEFIEEDRSGRHIKNRQTVLLLYISYIYIISRGHSTTVSWEISQVQCGQQWSQELVKLLELFWRFKIEILVYLFLLEFWVSFKNPRTHYQHQRKEGTVVKLNVSISQELGSRVFNSREQFGCRWS